MTSASRSNNCDVLNLIERGLQVEEVKAAGVVQEIVRRISLCLDDDECAILVVPQVALLATMSEQSKSRMLLPSRQHRNCGPGPAYYWDTTLSQRSFGTLACSGWVCLLPMVCFFGPRRL